MQFFPSSVVSDRWGWEERLLENITGWIVVFVGFLKRLLSKLMFHEKNVPENITG